MVENGDPRGNRDDPTFVGRDRELALLSAGLEDAMSGRGRLFLIGGEPGVGKTMLVKQLATRAAERGARVVWGRCWESGGPPAYWPWIEIIRTLIEDRDKAELLPHVGSGTRYIAQMAPGLGDLLGEAPGPLPDVGSPAARFYVFEAAATLLKNASSAQPLVLVLDDLHAADKPSLLLLQFLTRDLGAAHLLVVGTYREVEASQRTEVVETLAELVRVAQSIALGGLVRAEVTRLVEGLSGTLPSEETATAIYEATQGNPLFVREIVHLLASHSSLDRPGGPTTPLPVGVRAVIRRRLAPLSADGVQALSAAAVVGRHFDVLLLAEATGLGVDRILDSLSEAVALDVVTEDEGPPGLYRFSHPLIREVLFDSLPTPARMQLHRQVGRALERVYETDIDSHLAELAHHFSRVAAFGEGLKALEYGRRAGDRFMGAHGYEEAAAHYELALHALPSLRGNETERCELLLRLAAAQAKAGDYELAKATSLTAAEAARRLGSPEHLARAALTFGEPQVEGGLVNEQLVALLEEALEMLPPRDTPLRARLLARLALELTFSEEMKRMDSLSQEAVEIARRLGDPAALQGALRARWMAVWGPEGNEERSALAEEMLRLARETHDRELELVARARRMSSSLESGQIPTVEADLAAHRRVAAELRMPFHEWTAETTRAMLALLRGWFEEAETRAQEARSLQAGRPNASFAYLDQMFVIRWEQGRLAEIRERIVDLVEQFPAFGLARAMLSLADSQSGRDDDARKGLETLINGISGIRRDGNWLATLAVTSFACARLGAGGGAATLYPPLLSYAERTAAITMPHPVVCLGSVSLHLALLATAMSRWEEATDHFNDAIEMHDQMGARALLARTEYEYGRMLLYRDADGDRERAAELLDAALPRARDAGMVGVEHDIDTLLKLEQLSGVTRDGPPSVGLTVPAEAKNVFRREGAYWTIAYGGSVVRLIDSKGLRYLSYLLAHPGKEFHVVDLQTAESPGADRPPSEATSRSAPLELEVRPDMGDAGELLDAQAKAAYKARLDELQSELDEAERFNDPARIAMAREEMDFLVRELARAVGLGGRDRKAASHAERARLNVTRAIRGALANIGRADPSLGRHLSSTVRTGKYCSYTPDPRAPIRWEL